MNQRREPRSVNPIVVLALVFVLILVLLYWFVIRDGGSDDNNSKAKGSGAVGTQTFSAPGSSFSFKYPRSFVQTLGTNGYVFIAGVGAYDIITVKRLYNSARSPETLIKTIPETLTAVPGTTITNQGTDQRDGIPMVTFSMDTSLEGHAVKAKLYFFSANGVTWQLGCESETQAAKIDAACKQALASFRGPK